MRTFSPFTGSALDGLKRAELWPEFCRCMLEGESVRRTARRLGVHRDTAFRWRHRLLREIRAGESHPVGPVVNMGETHVVWGRRILVGLDDRGRALGAAIGSRSADVRDVRACLGNRLERGATVATVEGKYGAVARFVRSEFRGGSPAGPRQVRWRQRRHVDARYDSRIESVARFGFRFRRWLARFRGIAPHYTDNYLAWFRLVDGSLWVGTLVTGSPARPAPARSSATGPAWAEKGAGGGVVPEATDQR